MTIVLYDFEGPLDLATLERPPLCALRALRVGGFLLTRTGWDLTPHEQRLKLSLIGSQQHIDVTSVREALAHTPPRELKMFSKTDEPSREAAPDRLQGALGPGRSLPPEVWSGLRPIDRHVLAMLGSNARLLWRALDEVGAAIRTAPGHSPHGGWTGELAHVEIHMQADKLNTLHAPSFHDGRALVLSRVAGIRAARQAGELMDVFAQVMTGAVELGFGIAQEPRPSHVLCQAHVSSVDGEFFRAGSLVAASTSAATLAALVQELDPGVVMQKGKIVEEPWLVDDEEEATICQ